MNRRKDVFNSPEYRHIEENLDDILKELEEDEETRDLTMPEEWEDDFREILEKVNNEKKQRHRKKLRHTIVAAVVTVAILVPLIGLLGPKKVEGEGILELFESIVSFNEKRYGMAGMDETGLTINPSDLKIITFSANNMQELNEEIKKELKHPFYRINWIPAGFSIKEAIYNKDYDSLNIELYDGDRYIYVSQQFIIDTSVVSNVIQDNKESAVQNVNIGMKIGIYRSETDEGLSFSIIDNNTRMDCYMETTLEECKAIAESIIYE